MTTVTIQAQCGEDEEVFVQMNGGSAIYREVVLDDGGNLFVPAGDGIMVSVCERPRTQPKVSFGATFVTGDYSPDSVQSGPQSPGA